MWQSSKSDFCICLEKGDHNTSDHCKTGLSGIRFLPMGYWCFPEPLKQSPWFIYDDNYSTDENILLRISIRQNVLVHHVHVCNPSAAIAHNQMSNSIPKHQITAHWLEYMCISLSWRKCYSMPNIRMLNASTVSFITFIHFSDILKSQFMASIHSVCGARTWIFASKSITWLKTVRCFQWGAPVHEKGHSSFVLCVSKIHF